MPSKENIIHVVPLTMQNGAVTYWWTLNTKPPYLSDRRLDDWDGPFPDADSALRAASVIAGAMPENPKVLASEAPASNIEDEPYRKWTDFKKTRFWVDFEVPLDEFSERAYDQRGSEEFEDFKKALLVNFELRKDAPFADIIIKATQMELDLLRPYNSEIQGRYSKGTVQFALPASLIYWGEPIIDEFGELDYRERVLANVRLPGLYDEPFTAKIAMD